MAEQMNWNDSVHNSLLLLLLLLSYKILSNVVSHWILIHRNSMHNLISIAIRSQQQLQLRHTAQQRNA